MARLVDYFDTDEGAMFLVKLPQGDVILGVIGPDRLLDSERARAAFDAVEALIAAALRWQEADGVTLELTSATAELAAAIAQVRALMF